ncbi:hypothetical protein [Paraglaciecola aestuariivivens]
MLGSNSKSEKVEVVKSLIRRNNYKAYQLIFDQCSDLGISVNMHSLTRFAEKLELLDRAERTKRAAQQVDSEKPKSKFMSYEQVKRRETEITFELGELKIKENKLLEELNQLADLLDSNQIN